MIIILLQKTKEGINFTFKKIILPILVLIIFLIVNFYYFYGYYAKKGLAFTEEDKFLFLIFIVSLTFMVVSYVVLVFDRAKAIKIINKIKKEIADAEDNCILVNRDTQEIILNYLSNG